MSHAYHLVVAVSDIEKSKLFYDQVFSLLKWDIKHEDSESKAYTDGKFDFWIIPSENSAQSSGKGLGYNHVAFRVEAKEEVDKFYSWLLNSAGKVDIKPAVYPHYSKDYYAVFFFDPDGTRLEVVFA